MAKTHPVQALSQHHNDSPFLALAVRKVPVAASQGAVKAGWPLKLVSGLATEWVSVADADLAYFANEDFIRSGDSTAPAAGTMRRCIVADPAKVIVEGNLLVTSTYATNVLAAGDLGAEVTLEKGANLLDTGVAGWFFGDTTTGAALIIDDFASRYRDPTSAEDRAVAGDSDARLRARIKTSVSLWTPVS